ncbi:MAG: hypothetical protein Kow0097_12540 [Candidatus Bipolaricaulota bacterium]
MPRARKGGGRTNPTGGGLGFEAELWRMADALRGSMDAAEYKHVVLGLIFLKYVSDAFEEHRAKLESQRDQGADPEDPDEYRAENIFWVPPEARWSHLQRSARQPTIGQLVDDAMAAVERDNPSLEGVLPKDYARPALDKQRLGQLIDLVTNIHLGGGDNHARDILGRVYEYFLGQFATAEGKKGGEPRVYLAHILECIQEIERFTADGREHFLRGEMLQDAVLRDFEVIGEAAKGDDPYGTGDPEVPWRPWTV